MAMTRALAICVSVIGITSGFEKETVACRNLAGLSRATKMTQFGGICIPPVIVFPLASIGVIDKLAEKYANQHATLSDEISCGIR